MQIEGGAEMGKTQGASAPIAIDEHCRGCIFQERHMGVAYCKDAFAKEDGPIIIVTKKLHSDGVDYLRCEECLEHNCKY